MANKKKDLTYEDRKAIMDKYHSKNPGLVDESKQEMVDALEDYIYHLIHKRFARHIDMIEDLSQSGKMAIIMHMGDYNPQYKLTTFFSFHIQNEMQELVNRENGESHYYAESKNIIVKTIRKLGMDIDNIDEAVLAMHLNMTVGRLHSILEKTLHKKKVELIEEDGETSREFTAPPDVAYMQKESQQEFRDCLNELDEVENIVLCMHFGFYYPKFNEEERTHKLSEIQQKLDEAGISANAINEYRAARRHIADILYKKGIVGKRNKYQNAKEEIGLKFFDNDAADDLFDALNDIEDF